MNWQAQRTTELSVQVSHLTDTYVQNTQPNLYLFTSRSISGTKITQKLVFHLQDLKKTYSTYTARGPKLKRHSNEKTKKNLDASLLLLEFKRM